MFQLVQFWQILSKVIWFFQNFLKFEPILAKIWENFDIPYSTISIEYPHSTIIDPLETFDMTSHIFICAKADKSTHILSRPLSCQRDEKKIKGSRMGRSDKVSLWCVTLLVNTRFRFFILE